MISKIAIIGGDLRIIKLAEMFSKDNCKVYTYGLEKEIDISKNNNIEKCLSLNETIQKADIIVGPTPFSRDNIEINAPFANSKIYVKDLMQTLENKIFIAGSISTDIYKIAKESTNMIDLMKREELAILNTIATAEGTIELAFSNTDKILHGSNVLILGFGRIGKVLAKKLEGLCVNVTCAARKNEDFAWIKSYGYKALNINDINENLIKYDIIVNTVPSIVLTREKLEYINKDALIIDLASKPGGVDQEAVKEKNLKFIWALALPGKVAPVTSAEFMKDTIYNIIKEI